LIAYCILGSIGEQLKKRAGHVSGSRNGERKITAAIALAYCHHEFCDYFTF
jgi:hypothetical protein